MVKLRMNTADVAAEVKCLRSLIGMHCSNIYDLSPKTYVFKLAKSSGVTESGESEKVLLLIESGIRLHKTAFSRDKSSTPSGFTLKLRKHIRTKRLEDVKQLGMDRVVDFQFGMGERAFHIILELYAQGNLLLTDSNYTVLTLLRTHRDDDKGLTMMAHHQYPVDSCRHWEKTSLEKLEQILLSSKSDSNVNIIEENHTSADINLADEVIVKGKKSWKNTSAQKDKETLKDILAENLGYGPALSEHIVLEAGFQKNIKTFLKNKNGDLIPNMTRDMVHQIYSAIMKFENWLEEIIFHERLPEGYILLQKAGEKDSTLKQEPSSKFYEEFSPLILNQHIHRDSITFTTFDSAMDEFFSKVESQRIEQQRKAQEDSALQKLEKIRKDQANRVEALKKEVDHAVSLAELIEYNLEDVDAAILAVRSALATGMSWNDLTRMVKEERKAGNPIASMIHSLQLEKDQITLLLCNNLDDMEEEEKTQPATKVEVQLSLSAHANSRRWFDLKKKQAAKQEKTVAAHEKAFKAAERKTQQQLAQEKVVAAISHIRKVHWFEKFNWFISSENYLILSGRDAQQNELLVKRYLKKGDLYVHADLHGASSTIIKNHDQNTVVPPLTLNQAGCYTVCRSQAWDSKIVTSAWWVYAHQVSKTAPTGEYLTVGSFMIRGKKNFLPPHPLVMGFGLLFRLDESSVGAHIHERKMGQELEEYNDALDEIELGKDESNGIGEMTEIEENGETAEISEEIDSVSIKEDKSGPEPEMIDESKVNPEVTDKNVDFEELMDKALRLSARVSTEIPSEKYGLDTYPNVKSTALAPADASIDDDENAVSASAKGMQRQRPYLSKAERRRSKKGVQEANDVENGSKSVLETVDIERESDAPKKEMDDGKFNSKPESVAFGKIARGRKSKLKKIKEKYSEQDEEERELRMLLLASSGKQELDVADKKAPKKNRESSKEVLEVLDQSKICYKCKKTGHVAKDCPLSSAGPPSYHLEKQEIILEDAEQELADDEKEKLSELDMLTGRPLAEDILLYAIPVCGPYNALQSFKYRVKLTPGNAKRGKAAKTAMNVFLHMSEASSREKELMKAMTDPELVAAIIGNCKVTAPGLTQLTQRQKKGKKTSSNQD